MIIDFDLELAKEAQELETAKIITRDGREVIISDWDHPRSENDEYSLYGVVFDFFYERIPPRMATWTSEGRYLGPDQDNSLDLFIEPYDN